METVVEKIKSNEKKHMKNIGINNPEANGECFILLPVGYKREYFTEKQLRDLQLRLLRGYRFSDRDVSLLDAILSYMAVNVLAKQ